MSTQIGLRETMSLSDFINIYILIEVPLDAVIISLKAASVIFCRTFISRRRNPLANSSVIFRSAEIIGLYY